MLSATAHPGPNPTVDDIESCKVEAGTKQLLRGFNISARIAASGGTLVYIGLEWPRLEGDRLPAFYVRILGPTGIRRLRTVYCGAERAAVVANLHDIPHAAGVQGAYLIQVALEGRSFSFCSLQTSCGVTAPQDTSLFAMGPWLGYLVVTSGPQGAILQWSEDASPFTAALAATTPQQIPIRESYSLCPAYGPMKGRWVFNQWPAPEAQDLAVLCLNYATDPATKQRECALGQPNKMYNLPYRKTSLRWLPDGCRPPPPATLVERKPCMRKWLANGKKVCTLGDSHLRYLSRALKYWSESDVGSEFPAYGLDPLDNLKHEDLHMEQVSYYVELWGTLPAEQIQGKLAQCSVVFTSFGSWQMALNASISNYVEQLAAYTQTLARLAQTGVHVVWVGIPAHGFNVARTKPGCTDLRLAPVVETYDRLAYEMVHKYRMPYIDWFEPTVSLLEASQDSAHFSWNSPPGGLLLDKVVQSLCAHTDALASRYLRI